MSAANDITIIDAQFLAAATRQEELPPAMFAEIAFAGRSNVGKSSLLNRLVLRKKLARTSSTPGCTRGLNAFRVVARIPAGEGTTNATIDLVDLPGYGFAKRSKRERAGWGPMIEGYLEQRASLRAVVLIVDVRRGLEDDDRELLDYLAHIGRAAVVVATKLDKLPRAKQKPALEALRASAGVRVLGASAETGEGRDALLRALLRAASVGA